MTIPSRSGYGIERRPTASQLQQPQNNQYPHDRHDHYGYHQGAVPQSQNQDPQLLVTTKVMSNAKQPKQEIPLTNEERKNKVLTSAFLPLALNDLEGYRQTLAGIIEEKQRKLTSFFLYVEGETKAAIFDSMPLDQLLQHQGLVPSKPKENKADAKPQRSPNKSPIPEVPPKKSLVIDEDDGDQDEKITAKKDLDVMDADLKKMQVQPHDTPIKSEPTSPPTVLGPSSSVVMTELDRQEAKAIDELKSRYEAQREKLSKDMEEFHNRINAVLRDQSRFRPIVDAEELLRYQTLSSRFAILRSELRQTLCTSISMVQQHFNDIRRTNNTSIFNHALHEDDEQKRARKTRSSLGDKATRMLNTWFFANLNDPYPSEEDKGKFAKACDLTVCQINTWFGNKRIRHKRKIEEKIARKDQRCWRNLKSSTSGSTAKTTSSSPSASSPVSSPDQLTPSTPSLSSPLSQHRRSAMPSLAIQRQASLPSARPSPAQQRQLSLSSSLVLHPHPTASPATPSLARPSLELYPMKLSSPLPRPSSFQGSSLPSSPMTVPLDYPLLRPKSQTSFFSTHPALDRHNVPQSSMTSSIPRSLGMLSLTDANQSNIREL